MHETSINALPHYYYVCVGFQNLNRTFIAGYDNCGKVNLFLIAMDLKVASKLLQVLKLNSLLPLFLP